jgi:predicted metal-dependent phosphoesterase TrpH
MAVDLHAHSTASDGSDPPARLVEMAAETGLRSLALTDHDTQEGMAEAMTAAEGTDVEVIPGVELSLEFEQGGMHLLVLWLQPGPGPLQDRFAGLRHGRDERNLAIVERLTSVGLPVTIEEIEEEAGGGSVGRPHIAAVMMAHGYVPDIRTAFDLWLGKGDPPTSAGHVSIPVRRSAWRENQAECRSSPTPTPSASPPHRRWPIC